MTTRTRFAPSPTGYLHIGGLRTALYNYLFAKQQDGTFLLRIEDTDRNRLVERATESLVKTMIQMGLTPDEGVVLEGDVLVQHGERGPYIQSERLEIYEEHIQKLIDSGKAYHCFCSKERLDEVRKHQEIAKLPTKYDRHCCSLSEEEVKAKLDAGESFVVRFKIPEGETTFDDAVRGKITINNKEVDDQVIRKSDGFPTYHLAVVVDDHHMGVTHVIRGEEWISSVPKHVLLYEAFGFNLPTFAHLPLLLNPDRSKLSKRQGDVAVEDYLAKGYLPEALMNFVALCGFNPSGDQEIYTIDELIKSFDLSKVNKGGAVFDTQKLDWMNGMYIRHLSDEELMDRIKPFVNKEVSDSLLKKILAVEKGRMTRLNEIDDKIPEYTDSTDYDAEILIWKKADAKDAHEKLSAISQLLEGWTDVDFEDINLIEEKVKEYTKDKAWQNGNVLWPLRVSLSGKKASPSPFELLWVFGKEESLKRIADALSKLEA